MYLIVHVIQLTVSAERSYNAMFQLRVGGKWPREAMICVMSGY